jgi:hypothetical protein
MPHQQANRNRFTPPTTSPVGRAVAIERTGHGATFTNERN